MGLVMLLLLAQNPLRLRPMHAIQFEEFVKPEAILPVQFQHLWCETREVTPERALFIAVLEQAIDDLRNFRTGRPKGRHLYRKAYRWVASNDTTWPCSFLNVCDTLGLSAGALRAELLGKTIAQAA
jgi:hypothetical protein